jgi:[acyl-carrier-protein] S-malonyltransferase
MSLRDAVKAVRIRGQAMQSAVPVGKGGMSAVINLEAQQVRELCAWAEKETKDSPVSPANINAPGQIVISGKKAILDWIPAHFKPEVLSGNPARVKFIPLKVSAPFHCPMMKPAEEKMAVVLGDTQFQDAKFPVVQNVTAEPAVKAAELRGNLVKQVTAPVRWIECVQKMKDLGINKSVEAGCGKVLAGLVKKISPELSVLTMNSMDDIRAFEGAWKGANA